MDVLKINDDDDDDERSVAAVFGSGVWQQLVNVSDNTGYEILPDTGYNFVLDTGYRIQPDTQFLAGYRIIPDIWYIPIPAPQFLSFTIFQKTMLTFNLTFLT